MSEVKIVDLDLLRPERKMLKLCGKEIDYGFIPSGVALEFMRLKDQLDNINEVDDNNAVKSFELSAKVCALVTESQHKEMTTEWLLLNTNFLQLKKLVELIHTGITESLNSFRDDNVEEEKQDEVKKNQEQ